jgi:hypothetical protein
VFLFSGNCYGQKTISFQQDTFFKSKSKINEDKILFFNSNEAIFYTKNKIKDTLKIYKNDGSLFTLIYDKSLKNKNIKGIYFKKNKIYLSLFKKVYIFKNRCNLFRRKNEFKLNDSIIHMYRNITYLEKSNNLFFWNNYNYHPLDCPENERSKFGVYNLKKKSFEKEILNSFNYYYYYTHLISKFVSISPSGESIALSQTYPYKIILFDSDLNVKDSLERIIKYENRNLDKIDSYMDTTRRLNLPIQLVIRKASLNDTNVDRIVKTYFLDDSTLLVIKKFSHSNPNKKERNLDVWRLRNNKWILLVDNQPYSSQFLFKDKNNKFELHPGFLYSNQMYTESGFLFFEYRDIPSSITDYDELIDSLDSSYEDNAWSTLYKYSYEIK